MNSKELNSKFSTKTTKLQGFFDEYIEEGLEDAILEVSSSIEAKVSPFFFEFNGKTYAVGKTSDIKEDLKEMGFKFSQAFAPHWVK